MLNYLSNQLKVKLLFFICSLTSVISYAQCPTIPSSPIVVCDAAGFNFTDLSAFATDNGGGIVWYDSATGTVPFTDLQLVSEGIYFVDDSSNSCAGARPSIDLSFTVSPSGQNLDGIFCSNENATVQTYIDDVLLPNIPSGGSVEVYTDFDLTTLATSTDLLTANTNYFIVFVDSLGCRSQMEFGSTAVFPSPTTPMPTNPQQFCSDTNPTVGDLDPGTTENHDWYANVDGNGDPIPPALSAGLPLIDGATYYVQADNFFCQSDVAPVVVEIDDPVDAGIPGMLDFCEDSVPTTDINLFDVLTGTPDTTGTWTGPLATSNGHLGTINLTGQTAGTLTFTYTVPPVNACPEATSTVTIIIHEVLTSGTVSANSPAIFCESVAPSNFDLNSLLDNEDLGGQWTQGTLSTDPIVVSPIDLSGFTPGLYDFTYTQNVSPNPCPEESTTVQVEILADPNPGVALTTEFCENNLVPNPFDLFTALDGSQDNNSGTWTDATGTAVSNPIDISSFDAANSPFIFTYTINNGTCEDSEDVILTVLPAPDSGNYVGAPLEICLDQVAANSPYDLFNLLDGTQDTNGTWYSGSDTTGAVVTNPLDLSTLGTGSFNFTYDVPPVVTCTDAPVTVEIIINDLPITGTATPFTACVNDLAANSPLDLFGQLAGNDAGGTWSDDSGSGALTGSNVDLTLLSVGTFNYTYSISDSNTCTNNSTVVITIEDAPDSGNYVGAPLEICLDQVAANSPYDLFNLLDGTQDTNGTWYSGSDTTGAVLTNPLDLSTLGTGAFNFTYDVPAIGTCTDAPVTVEIVINDLPVTGTATPFTVCETTTDTSFDLFGQLAGNDAGGTWSDDSGSGALTGSNVDLTALAVGSYNFSYSISDSNTCTNNSTVVITIEAAPEAGTGTNFEICLIDVATTPTLDLFNQLAGNDAGGTWSDDDTSGALTGNTIDLTALTINTTYNYTYTVTGVGTCTDDTETVTVTVIESNAPTVNAIQNFCDAATVADLSATGTTVQWYDDATLGSPLATTTPLVDGETYYASQTIGICESATRSEVTVTIFISPNSGIALNDTICDTEAAYDLFTALDGSEDATGVWADTSGSGALSGSVFDATAVTPGTYTFTYTVVANPPCIDASTIVTITVESPVTAGTVTAATLDFCATMGTTYDLFNNLTGNSPGGDWSLNGNVISNPIDLTTAEDGTYIYTVASACNFETIQFDITIIDEADAGINATVTYCEADGTVDLLTLLGGTPDNTGTWSPLLDSGTNMFDPQVDGTGIYTYTVLATSPCTTNAVATLNITVNAIAAPTQTSTNEIFCLVDSPTVADLNAFVTGNNIQWYDTNTSTTALPATTALVDGEDYFATQSETASSCVSTQRAQITVTISDAATPTLITEGELFCINDNPTFASLTANIIEVNTTLDNVVWYDALTGGTAYVDTDALTDGATYYAALINSTSNCESSVRLMVTVDLSACGDIDIPDGFSPNGDGVNDSFTIENIEFLYPNYELEFYNRYGNLVYKANASTEDFKGRSNQSRVLSKTDLPVGVYYYILNFNDGTTKAKQGRLYLNR